MPVDLLADRKPRDLLATATPTTPPSYANTDFAQSTSGLNEGIANILGTPVDLANAAIGLGMRGINAVAGTNLQPSAIPLGGSAGLKQSLSQMGAIQPPTSTPRQQFERRTAQTVGAASIPMLGQMGTAVAPLATAAKMLIPALTGGATAATVNQLLPGNRTADMLGELAGSLVPTAAISAAERFASNAAARNTVPTAEKLKQDAGNLYEAARKNGVTASNQQTTALRDSMRAIAQDQGLVTPTGRVASSYPKITDALNNFEDYAQGTMSVPQMQSTRRLLQAAAQSADGTESRIGTMMLKQFDAFVDPMAPQIKFANQLYHRAMKADTINQAIDLAEAGAKKFSASGYENSLRGEFRNMDRNLIKENLVGYTPQEQDAIANISRGTTASNIARNIGRMAPTGPVSFATSAGVPFAIGNALGGPPLGAALATGTSGAGYLARGIATKMASRAADNAELLARNGGVSLPQGAPNPDEIRRWLTAILTNTANGTSR